MATQKEMNKRILDAAEKGNVDTLQDCIDKGAEVNCQNSYGLTPLHIAAVSGHTGIVLKIIMKGVDMIVKNNLGQSPLHLAVKFGKQNVVDLLLNAGVSPCVEDNEGRTPLHIAAWFGHRDIASRLLEANASLTAKDIRGQTPLHIAAMNEYKKLVCCLLEAGASESEKDNKGWTPLHWTAQTGTIKVLDLLLKNNATLNVGDNQGRTPLHLAAGRRHAQFVIYMLSAGASLSSEDNEGLTPLRIAEMDHNAEVVDLLRRAVAPLPVVDNEGKTSYDVASGGSKRLPQKYIDNTDEIIAQFPMNGTSDESKELWSKGIFIAYENCVYLGGDCNVEKSTLASILIGEEIPQHSMSNDGLNIYFGRNGIDLRNTKMVPLKQATIQEDIKQEIRKGTYKIEIAPSYLAGFGGQMFFDMTPQLFMRHKGTFVLMFNGRIDLSVPLDEYKKGETTESILKHWVNCILSYCADDGDILPKIMFSATHSDDFNQEDREIRKNKLIHDLGEIFKNHEREDHIIYDDIFFINGQDKSDPDIDKLKFKLVEVACKQKSWGRPTPMAWVPLDLHMSELRLHNMNIISKEELITLNKRNEGLALTVEQIKYFLNDQHSLGKILYFNQKGLDHFIIVQPHSLVNILRSFITAKLFWPEEKELKDILCTLTNTGKIVKQDLLKLWSQKKFHQYMPNDDFKEFIIQVLVHLDILVELKQESKVQSYLVPCIFTDCYVNSAERMICLSYTFLESSIPAALFSKLIGAAIIVWPLREKLGGIYLYRQAAILCIDESNELHLLVEDNKVLVYLINKTTKRFIPPNIASTVQECLTLTMTKELKLVSTSEVSKEFEIEVGEWCTSGGGCYISVPKVKEGGEWICKNNKEHDPKFPLYWIFDKKQLECDESCSGLDEKDLALHPEDKHLFRLAKLIPPDECSSLALRLGVSCITWDDIQCSHESDSSVTMFLALCQWKRQMHVRLSKPSLKELYEALAKDHHSHFLCQVFTEDVTVYDIANVALQQTPEDDVLQDLSKQVSNCAVHLGVELGLHMVVIEFAQFMHPKNMFQQTFHVMKEWKLSSKVHTILMLMKAFQSVDARGLHFLRNNYRV